MKRLYLTEKQFYKRVHELYEREIMGEQWGESTLNYLHFSETSEGDDLKAFVFFYIRKIKKFKVKGFKYKVYKTKFKKAHNGTAARAASIKIVRKELK